MLNSEPESAFSSLCQLLSANNDRKFDWFVCVSCDETWTYV